MIELSRTRDGEKVEGMDRWREACFMGNGLKEGDAVGREGAGGEKQLQCSPSSPPPSNLDAVSGEFALVINGHSLVRITQPHMLTQRAHMQNKQGP